MEYQGQSSGWPRLCHWLLAYYDFDDLPKKFDVIHLEYFEEALCYMLQHTGSPDVLYHSLQDQPQRAVPLHSPAVGALVLLCASFTEISFGDFLGFSA